MRFYVSIALFSEVVIVVNFVVAVVVVVSAACCAYATESLARYKFRNFF